MSPQQKFKELLASPAQVNSEDDDFIKTYTAKYPYCQSLHLLGARQSKALRQPDEQRKVALAAIYSPDRSVLFNLTNLPFEINKAAPAVQEQEVHVYTPFEEDDYIIASPNLENNLREKPDMDQAPDQAIVTEPDSPAPSLNVQSVDLVETSPETEPLVEVNNVVPKTTTKPTYSWSEEIPVRKTFLYWLKKTQKGYFLDPGKTSLKPVPVEVNTEAVIIDTFLKEGPSQIKSQSAREEEIKKLVEIATLDDELYTDTIANILYIQKHYKKAIRAYQYLSQNNLEKASHYQNVIEGIKLEAGIAN